MAALTVLQEEYKNYSLSITVNGTKEQINPTPSLPGPEYDNAGQESNDISKCVAKVLHEHSSTVCSTTTLCFKFLLKKGEFGRVYFEEDASEIFI